MCGLCGFLGIDHWTETALADAVTPELSSATRRRERAYRVRFIDRALRHYGLHLQDWQRRSFLLANRTGRTEVVDSPAALWATAEKLLGRRLDPLDPVLLDAIDAQSGGG